MHVYICVRAYIYTCMSLHTPLDRPMYQCLQTMQLNNPTYNPQNIPYPTNTNNPYNYNPYNPYNPDIQIYSHYILKTII